MWFHGLKAECLNAIFISCCRFQIFELLPHFQRIDYLSSYYDYYYYSWLKIIVVDVEIPQIINLVINMKYKLIISDTLRQHQIIGARIL
jgi:hypothetical protein